MEEGPKQYQLKQKCLLVDATDYETGTRIPGEFPFAHVMDQSTEPYTYLALTDSAAFIARFIVLGVNVDLIAEILSSEYRFTLKDEVLKINFKEEVEAVVGMIKDYIEERTLGMGYLPPELVDLKGYKIISVYSLDFGVHSPGGVCCKIPSIKPPKIKILHS